jgi:chromosome segregation ATPase
MYNLEEFPPPDRRRLPKPANEAQPARDAKPVKEVRSPKPARQSREPNPVRSIEEVRAPGRPWVRFAVLLLVAGTAGAGTYLWIDRRMTELEGNVAHALTTLEDAGGSLRLLWNTTTKLDENQAARQALLQDSIVSVKAFVETELGKLWETAYKDHEARLVQNDDRLRRHDNSIRQVAEATGRTNIRLDAMLSQNRTLEQNLRSVNETADALRETIVALSGQIQELQNQLSTARASQVQIANRVNGVETWVEGFRDENLSAATVRDRLASLARDLRAVSLRVDSLRTQTGIVTNSRPR